MSQADIQWHIVRSLWTVNVAASALVLWRLYNIEAIRIYRFFFLSILLKLAVSASLYPFSPRTATYYWIWVVTKPLVWISFVLIVVELNNLILKRYRGIHSLSRWFFYVAVAGSVIISALIVMTTMSDKLSPRFPLLYPFALLDRSIETSLALFILMLLTLVAWFSIPLSRNLLRHAFLYATYFFLGNVIFLYWHVKGTDGTFWANCAGLSVAALCYLGWVFLLSRSGEQSTASLRLGRSAAEERKVLAQLEGINATLLRVARK
jgi:hypothetical protein